MRLRRAQSVLARRCLTARGTYCSITGRLDNAQYPRHNPVTSSDGRVMSAPYEPVPSYPGVPAEAPAGAGARIAAELGAFFVLVGGAIFSFGTVLLAPLAMPIAAAIWRRRGSRLPVVGHWIAALCGAAIIIGGLALLTSAFVPKSAWTDLRHTMDSASTVAAAQQRSGNAAVDSAARGAARRPRSSTAMGVALAYGFCFAAIFMVAIFGTIGWIGGMLFGLAATGHWPGTAPASGSHAFGNA